MIRESNYQLAQHDMTQLAQDPVVHAAVLTTCLVGFVAIYFTKGFTFWSASRGKQSGFPCQALLSPHRQQTDELQQLHVGVRRLQRLGTAATRRAKRS